MEWKQKHNIMFWTETSKYVGYEATHRRSWGYNKRGRWGRVLRISDAKRRLIDGMKWVTRRYSRYMTTQ